MTTTDLIGFLRTAYADEPWPKPFHVLEGVQKINAGLSVKDAAKATGTHAKRLEDTRKSNDPEFDILGVRPAEITEDDIKRAGTILGGLLLGRAAEMAFEDIYRSAIGPDSDFKLVDLRKGRSDTDYRVLDGRDRPVYRVNIKFTGSTFRLAPDLVGLEPHDCFPLATYKIFGALKKQDEEHLPYIFAVVGVPDLTAISVQSELIKDDTQFIALFTKSKRIPGKRSIEDKVVDRIAARKSISFMDAYSRIWAAEWYVLSARKADMLLRDRLFERVYALKLRSFTRKFRGAELDMHFSLGKDLIALKDFLRTLKEEGPTKIASLLERGTF
jgi:hypothetical protein